MKKEIKERWVAALRSGEYAQTRQRLADDDGFCCLGVLCEIAEQDQVVIKSGSGGRFMYTSKVDTEDCELSILPMAVADWAEFGSNPVLDVPLKFFSEEQIAKVNDQDRIFDGRIRSSLAELNDYFHFDFNKIADVIEEAV